MSCPANLPYGRLSRTRAVLRCSYQGVVLLPDARSRVSHGRRTPTTEDLRQQIRPPYRTDRDVAPFVQRSTHWRLSRAPLPGILQIRSSPSLVRVALAPPSQSS